MHIHFNLHQTLFFVDDFTAVTVYTYVNKIYEVKKRHENLRCSLITISIKK